MTGWPSLRINVGRLRQRSIDPRQVVAPDGDVITLDERLAATDLEITTAKIDPETEVEVSGTVQGSLTGIEAHLLVKARWVGECRRCLDTVSGPVEIDSTFSFLEELADGSAAEADDADAYVLEGDWIDLGEVVREELMLTLPLTPLCEFNCAGADPERFPTGPDAPVLEDDDSELGEDAPIDPRWAGLSELVFEDSDEESPDGS